MRRLTLILLSGIMVLLIFANCSEDKNACESYYDNLCSNESYFNEPEEYYHQQKVLECNCIKNERSDFTDYEKIECDRFLKSLSQLDESVPEQKKDLQWCSVQSQLLDKYGDTYINTCLMRNGTDNCKKAKDQCANDCPKDSDEAYKGCIAQCNAKFPCDTLCDGFEFN
ncbi:MAG: hypothetical protein ACP5KG_06005 [Myxococcota bacterium]